MLMETMRIELAFSVNGKKAEPVQSRDKPEAAEQPDKHAESSPDAGVRPASRDPLPE